jgi:triosephosphate isomerase
VEVHAASDFQDQTTFETMRPLITGNWKMNGLTAHLSAIHALAASMRVRKPRADVLICPPFTLIEQAVRAGEGLVLIGAQNCHHEAFGARTGQVSAEMVKDSGAMAVIVGHSECRQQQGDSDAIVEAKAHAATDRGLLAIICVGETESQRNAGQALSVCDRQITHCVPQSASASQFVIGYEPLWAVGHGQTPSADEITEMHAHIRHRLVTRLGATGNDVRIVYGGSVTAENAESILALAEVGGLLVGAASLNPAEFERIVRAVPP